MSKSFTLVVVSLLSTLGASSAAFAEDTPGIVDAYNAQRQIRNELAQGNTAETSQQALNILVDQGLTTLAENGESTLAGQLRGEWNTQFANFLPNHFAPGAFGLDDIGDHDPLSPWLANLHDTLQKKVGGVLGAVRIINDIFTMNYALGVVLHPKSTKWKSGEAQEDEWEYRKHFIPMANIITYWVTLEACNYIAAKKLPAAKQLCGTAASKLEFYMGRYWAPKLSDFVYRQSNGIKSVNGSVWASKSRLTEDFDLTEEQFEAEVLAAVHP